METDFDEHDDEIEEFEHRRFKADPKQQPLRLDLFLMSRVEKLSRNRLQQMIKDGAVRIDGEPVKQNHKIKPGEVVTIVLPEAPKPPGSIEAEPISLDIRYEDDHLLVVYKPPGMVVHPGVGNNSGTLVNGLAYHFSSGLPVMPGNLPDRPGLVHRIDKNTSGLLVIAKKPEAMTHLAEQFAKHSIERRYVALVWGEPKEDKGTIVAHIGRHPRYRLQMAAFPEGEQGKHAITHYKVLERLYYVSLVECKLETGRTHQIRVHMAYSGHPLFNDERYGGDKIVKGTVYSKYKQFVDNCFDMLPRHALHARTLGFIHPATNKYMEFEAPLPPDMSDCLDKWRNYLSSRKS